MPKRPAPDTLRVLVAVPSYHKDLLADLQTVPARGRAARLRLLAEMGLLRVGRPTTVPSLPPGTTEEIPAAAPTPAPFGLDDGAPRRAKMGKYKGRLLG
ncbi:MAG: hypothetical protein ACYDEV_04260 [Acidiferrobacter sp.]